nr:hypothetical protein [Solirubrobacterales bacterium]
GHATDDALRSLRAGARDGVTVVAVPPGGLDQVDGPIDVLFVGRCGRYSTAVEALERWGARVVPGGTLFIHGAFAAPPLTGALLRTVGSSPAWRYFGRDEELAEYTRAQLTTGERVLDAVAQVAQLPAFARSLARRRAQRLRSR